MLKIHGALLSPFVRKVRITLGEKQIPYELVRANPFEKSPEFLALSPLGRIPALEDELGRKLADSSVIVEYIEERFPEPPLFTRDPYDRARVRWFDEYADGGMGPSITGKIFFQRVINAKLMKNAPDERIIAGALAEIPTYFAYLESQLDGNEYLVAGRFTLADISVLCQLVNLGHAGVGIDATTYPTLSRWFTRVTDRPTVTPLIEQDRSFLAKVAG
jgi:glutathione S-transferase